MKITVLYFASLRETLGTERETLTLTESVKTVGELRESIATRGAPWDALLAARVKAALNQELCSASAALCDGAEVAFFPPVTGG